jgi:hypothetical protein
MKQEDGVNPTISRKTDHEVEIINKMKLVFDNKIILCYVF